MKPAIRKKLELAGWLAVSFLASPVFGDDPQDPPEEEGNEIIIPLKTGYAPLEREAISGLDLSHSGEADILVTSLEFEYSFFNRIEFDLELPLVSRFADTNQVGLGDVETGIKVKLLESEDDFHLAGGLEVTWPVGQVSKEIGEGKTEVGPFLLAAKRFGPVSLLGDVGYERVVTTRGIEAEEAEKNSFHANLAVAYTFPFQLSPLLELNGSFADLNVLSVTPGLVYALTERFQARAGIQVPVTSDKEFDWKTLFQLLYDFQ